MYTNPQFNPKVLVKQKSMADKDKKKSDSHKISDLRNPFKKWKPSQKSKQTSRVMKQINQITEFQLQQEMGLYNQQNEDPN